MQATTDVNKMHGKAETHRKTHTLAVNVEVILGENLVKIVRDPLALRYFIIYFICLIIKLFKNRNLNNTRNISSALILLL